MKTHPQIQLIFEQILLDNEQQHIANRVDLQDQVEPECETMRDIVENGDQDFVYRICSRYGWRLHPTNRILFRNLWNFLANLL